MCIRDSPAPSLLSRHPLLQESNVIMLFRLMDNVISGTSGEDGVVTAMEGLTAQAQERGSTLYGGMVTDKIDPAWGIVAVSLDVSLRLTTAIEVIGGDAVREGWVVATFGSPVTASTAEYDACDCDETCYLTLFEQTAWGSGTITF